MKFNYHYRPYLSQQKKKKGEEVGISNYYPNITILNLFCFNIYYILIIILFSPSYMLAIYYLE